MKMIKWSLIGMGIAAALIALVFIVGFGLEFLQYSKAESSSEINKVEKEALKYLSDKYGEAFDIREVRYSRQLGEKEGAYTIEANPAAEKHLLFFIQMGEDMEQPEDDYKENKWRQEAKESLRPIMDQLFPERFGYMVNTNIMNEENYSIHDTYAKIAQEQPNANSLYVFIYPFSERFTEETESKELERLFEMYKHMRSLGLKDFSIRVEYLQKTASTTAEAAEFDYQEASKQQAFYIFDLDTRGGEKTKDLQTPEELKPFGRFLQ